VAAPFVLKPHVFLCPAKRHWVILDVNRDKYLCVDRRQFESLGPWLHGWQQGAQGAECQAGAPADEALALANRLLSVGILSEHAEGAKQVRSTARKLPTAAADLDLPASARRSACAHALPFFLSSAKADRQLRSQPFQSVVGYVQERKQRKASSVRPFDLDRARALTEVFDRLRLFYPRPYLCLFDSLALIHFLARFDLYPDWVFAVMADPFEAHCWVQAGNVVLNDTLERVSPLTTIMSV
jgi:hypothetical protein